MAERTVPLTEPEDDDDVVVALETARVSEERGDLAAAHKWLHRAAAAARRQGRPERAGSISRSAAQMETQQRLEPAEPLPQALADIEDEDFAESTVVETAEAIINRSAAAQASAQVVKVEVPSLQTMQTSSGTSKATAVGPASAFGITDNSAGLRVAVQTLTGGRFEARALSPGESAKTGELEALLVPVTSGASVESTVAAAEE